MKFINPFDGAMMCSAAGRLCSGQLVVDFTLSAQPGQLITVNGVPAAEREGTYTAAVPLDGYRNTVEARNALSGETEAIVVYWLKNAENKYRLSLDDNIWCLQNIAKNQDRYDSLFDDPYLRIYKDVHDAFGTKVHMNIYYDCPEFGGFTLKDMPDKYRDEFRANADWFKLAFHAARNLPDRIYADASYETLRDDMQKVYREVLRFAGEEALSRDVTTLHWGCATRYGVRALRTMGIRAVMASYRCPPKWDSYDINLHLTDEQTLRVHPYTAYKDHAEDIICVADDLYLNMYTPTEITEQLERQEQLYPKRRFHDCLIHEEYFYPHYCMYLPDYRDRVFAGVRWCAEHGYEPAFLKEILFED